MWSDEVVTKQSVSVAQNEVVAEAILCMWKRNGKPQQPGNGEPKTKAENNTHLEVEVSRL